MPSKFVRLRGDNLDMLINLEQVTHVEKIDDFVAIWYTGDTDYLKLTGEVAESFWRYFTSISLCIHRKQHKSQSDDALADDTSGRRAVNLAQQSNTADRPN